MTKDGAWRLSPAYDLTFSVDPSAPAYMNRHALSQNCKTEDITREDLETLAQRNDIQDYRSLIKGSKALSMSLKTMPWRWTWISSSLISLKRSLSELKIENREVIGVPARFNLFVPLSTQFVSRTRFCA